MVSQYTYSGPAWAKSDDEFSRPALRTHNDWRGYREVKVTKGGKSSSEVGVPQSQSQSVSRYFQGTGGEFKDSTGTYTLLSDDAPQYAGMTAEAITYVDSDSKILKRTLNYPWSRQTASRARENEDATDADPLLAHRTGVKRSDDVQTVGTSWRAVRTLTTPDDTYGLPVQVETAVVRPSGTTEVLSDQTCTKTSYLHNTSAWLIGLPKEQRTTGTSCAGYATADPATQFKSSVQNTYDGLAYGATPTRGLITSMADINGGRHGALRRHRDDVRRSRPRAQRSASRAARAAPRRSTRPGGRPGHRDKDDQRLGPRRDRGLRPGARYAAHGHRRQQPGHPQRVRRARPPGEGLGRVAFLGRQVAERDHRLSAGDRHLQREPPGRGGRRHAQGRRLVRPGVTLYDGLMREVQQQIEAHGPGRIIVDTNYDDHGLVVEKTGGYLAKDEPGTELFAPRSESLIPSSTQFRYDGLEREARASVTTAARTSTRPSPFMTPSVRR